MKKINKILMTLLVILTLNFVTGCGSVTENNSKTKFSTGETFTFSGLELTIGKDISFTQVKSEWSDRKGEDIVKIPVHVKNISEESNSLNMFYYKAFGSQGTEVDNLASSLSIWDDVKDTIDDAGDLRPGAEYDKYFYFKYDGNGTYVIEFSELIGEKYEVSIDVNK